MGFIQGLKTLANENKQYLMEILVHSLKTFSYILKTNWWTYLQSSPPSGRSAHHFGHRSAERGWLIDWLKESTKTKQRRKLVLMCTWKHPKDQNQNWGPDSISSPPHASKPHTMARLIFLNPRQTTAAGQKNTQQSSLFWGDSQHKVDWGGYLKAQSFHSSWASGMKMH